MTKKKPSQAESKTGEKEQTFISHLFELRDRLLRIAIVIAVITVALMLVANDLYYYFSIPLQQYLPENTAMIATGVISPIFTPLKLALIGAFFISIPYILHQAWGFVAPGLYKNERQLAIPLLVSSVILFYLGMAFAYAVVFPLVFQFTSTYIPTGVEYRPDIADYLDFALKMFFAFGLAFEVPIATIIVIAAGLTTPENLVKKRPYIIVGAFTVGMLLTPPDIISQVMLALPMWLLFELGIIASKFLLKKRLANREKEQQFADNDMSEEEMEAEFDKAIEEEDKLNKNNSA